MFTKKLEDQFSADLLNTVRGVLDESKKCKDCGCSKCECEDEEDEKDEMKEANLTGLPKSTAEKNKQYIEITHLLGHKRRVPVHPTNAYKALNRYRNDPSTKSARIVSENVEQIDELSKKTLGSYVKKAAGHVGAEAITAGLKIKSGENPTPNLNKALKRQKGIETAAKKLTKEEQEFIDALNDADIDQIDENAWNQLGQKKPVGNTLPAPAKGSVPKHGRKFREGDHVVPHSGPYAGQVHRVTSSRAGSVNIVRPNTPKYNSVTVRAKHEHLSPATPEQAAKYKAAREADHKRMFGEEAEQIDELSVKTLDNYRTKARKEIIDADANDDNHLYNKRAKGYRAASKSVSKKFAKEEAEQIDEISAEKLVRYKDAAYKDSHKREKGISRALSKLVGGAKTKVWSDGRKNPVKEEVELEEGRGRPPKEGTPAWHARQKQANDDMVALGVQLRKAKSMNKKVRFMNGKEHEIHPNHIDKFEDHMAARKTSQDKAAFQKQAHKSHEDFVKAVTAPVPKSSKDTGEIVKYRH